LEHPAEVLTADGFDEAPPDSIRAELGQGPTAVGETNHGGWLVGESAEGGPLLCGDPCRRPASAAAAYPVQPPAVEGMQVGVNGVGVEAEEAGNRGSVPPLGREDDGLGPPPLPTVGGGVQEAA